MKTACEHPMATELFLLRDETGPILYAPLAKKMARVNEGAVSAVESYIAGELPDGEPRGVIDTLKGHGFFAEYPLPMPQKVFKPVHVTLFPTDACNLRCRYCYASAEGGKNRLTIAAAKAAVDIVSQNAKDLGRDNFLVGFHGNGEPFMAFDLIKDVCKHANERAEALGVKATISMATNGALTEDKLDFLLAWVDNTNISFDGLPDLQDSQRPFADGKGSFDAVDRTISRLDAAGASYGVRATLTTEGVDRLPEMVRFVAERYPRCSVFHIEPVWECGRCVTTGEKRPASEAFIKRYLEAIEYLKDSQLRLVYSGARQDILSCSFCSVSYGSFTITPSGYVTACYEVCERSDARSGRYFYGRFDEALRQYVFDHDKMEALSGLSVHHMDYCKDCFCKWHCAGDCPAKLLGVREPGEHEGSDRCEINRVLTLNQIQRMMDYSEVGEHV